MMRMMANLCMVDNIKSKESEVLTEFLACLKALMNNKQGLENVIATPDAIRTIVLPLRLGYIQVNLQVLELLAVFCWYNDTAHSLTTAAMTEFQHFNREPVRFATLVHALDTVKNVDLQMASMKFINAIVTNPVTIEERIPLRSDFLALNLPGIMARISEDENTPEAFRTQVEVFEKMMQEDAVKSAYNDQVSTICTHPSLVFRSNASRPYLFHPC